MTAARSVARVPEHPILFSAPMVKAILAGTKTQTRRVLHGYNDASIDRWDEFPDGWEPSGDCGMQNGLREAKGRTIRCPFGRAGDRLWVRETWAPHADEVRYLDAKLPWSAAVFYAADGLFRQGDTDAGEIFAREHLHINRWHPSIYMPRWASRITLEVTDVRVERLQAISEEDARAEGVTGDCGVGNLREYLKGRCQYHFASLWDEINGKRAPWSSNPWVWVVSFRRVTP